MLTNDKKKGVGRIYTSNVAIAGIGPKSFDSLEEVIKVFGKGSDEANVAEAFFNFIAESRCSNVGIQFASWGYGGSDPWKRFTAEGSAATGFSFFNLDTSAVTTYASLKEAFDAIGDRAIISVKLTGDVLYISEATKADSERYAALCATCGEANLNATSDENKLNGFVVGKKQIVVFDLNGHKMCGDCNVIRNLGYMTVNDSVGTGCVFTTNFEKTIFGSDHSSRFDHVLPVATTYMVGADIYDITGSLAIAAIPYDNVIVNLTESNGNKSLECYMPYDANCFGEGKGGWKYVAAEGDWGTVAMTETGTFSISGFGGTVVTKTGLSFTGTMAKKNRTTTESVRNEGSLTINGGWFGTDRAEDRAWVNEVNWGQCLSGHRNSATIVNGGHFTTISSFGGSSTGIVPKLASDVGQDSWFATRKFSKTDGWNYTPYAAIIDTYDTAQVQWNGGECYGLYNDIFEVEGKGTTETDFGGVQIFDGEFYVGFKDFTFTPGSMFGMQSMFQASAVTNQYLISELPLPGTDAFEGYSPIIIYGGTFRDNIALYTASGEKARISPPRGRKVYPDPALNMTGRVSVLGGDFNFSFSQEFSDYRVAYAFRGLTKATLSETKTNAIEKVFADADDLLTFGVFGFIDGETKDEAVTVGKLVSADKCQHIYCVTGTDEVTGDGIAPLDSLDEMGEVCRAFQPITAKHKTGSV